MFRFDFKIDQETTNFDSKNTEDGTIGISTEIIKEKAQHQEWFDAMEIVPSKEIVETLDYCELHAIDTQVGSAGNNTGGTCTIRHIVSGAMLEDIKGDAKSAASISLSEQEHSDLLPGVYEGGAKIWECTNDLLDYLVENFDTDWQQKRVLDLGCGSGLLGIYAQKQGAIVHYQDYNRDVLEKITIPNVLMNMSSKAKKEDQGGDRNAIESSSESEDSDGESVSDADRQDNQLQTKKGNNKEIKSEIAKKEPEPETPCNKKPKLIKLEISSSSYDSSTLIKTLTAIETKFYAGDWYKYATLTANDESFDIILSSETIYNPENQIKLLDTFAKRLNRDGDSKVLIAAKTHYFGVGGGTRQFELKVQEHGEFQTRVVWQGGHEGGVKREILELSFINQSS